MVLKSIYRNKKLDQTFTIAQAQSSFLSFYSDILLIKRFMELRYMDLKKILGNLPKEIFELQGNF